MDSSPRRVGRLLVTGVPGWLTDAFLWSLQADPLPGLTAARCLVQSPGLPGEAHERDDSRFDVEYVVGDLRDSAGLAAAMRGVDTVFHAAGILHVRRTADWYEVNTRGTEHLIDAAINAEVTRFVFISSNAAAGRAPSRERLLTEVDPPRPRSHYGRSKWLAEEVVNSRRQRLETVILRPCTFYGPPVPARHVAFYRRIATGWVPLIGDGHFARSLSYIDNLVQGCRLALTHPAAIGQTYYLSDGPVYTTRRIIEAMASALGVEPRFVQFPRLMGPVAYHLDMVVARVGFYWQSLHLLGEADWHVGVSCEKARRELGYSPKVELEEGMKKAIEWCRTVGKLP